MQTDTVIPTTEQTDARAGKYLIFRLGREEFGVPVLQAQEILPMQGMTAVPNTPPHIRGVLNLRGKIIPIIDLRLKFRFTPEPDSLNTCIVAVRVQRGAESLLVGMVVIR